MFLTSLLAAVLIAGHHVHGFFAEAQGGIVDLTLPAQNSRRAQGIKARILKEMSRDPPYMEARLQHVNIDGIPFENLMKRMARNLFSNPAESEKQMAEVDVDHLFVRSHLVPQSAKFGVEMNINIDDDMGSSSTASRWTVRDTTATIDTQREGWNDDSSTEVGGSATASAGFDALGVAVSASATVSGNKRWSNSRNAEESKQSEWRRETEYSVECPPWTICSVQTWTFRTTITGQWAVLPMVDRSGRPSGFNDTGVEAGNYSLLIWPFSKLGVEQVFAELSPSFNSYNSSHNETEEFKKDLARLETKTATVPATSSDEFMVQTEKTLEDMNEMMKHKRLHGDIHQGVLMHQEDAIVKYKYAKNLTFARTLTWPNGKPWSISVLVEQRDDGSVIERPLSEPIHSQHKRRARLPRAVAWRVHEPEHDADVPFAYCELQGGWACTHNRRCYFPGEQGEHGGWFTASPDEWEELDDADKNCLPLKVKAPPQQPFPESIFHQANKASNETKASPLSLRKRRVQRGRDANFREASGVKITVLRDETPEMMQALRDGLV